MIILIEGAAGERCGIAVINAAAVILRFVLSECTGGQREVLIVIDRAAAAGENIRLARKRRNSKIYALKLKAQMKAEALKEKIADKKAERDKAALEGYILDLLDYAQYCQQIAFADAIEADLTLLDAAEAAAEYIEKYGEPVAEDAEWLSKT